MAAFKITEITKYATIHTVEGFDTEDEACEYFRDNYEEITSSPLLTELVDCYIYNCEEVKNEN